jgi:hypothetical protein
MMINHKQTASDVEEELRFHVEMLESSYSRKGMSVAEAKTAAASRFGNLERVKRQCVAIRKRNGLRRRMLKLSTIFLALIGLAIHMLASDYKVARIGHTLIMIAIAGRLLLYVRGLSPWTPSSR